MLLQGITVIDFSRYLPGPHASLRLVELGAEVMKIESPEGDPAREREITFRSQNRGKKSVCIDLKTEEGRQFALQLIRKADVVLESFRPGVADRLGIGYEDAAAVKPDIVYCSLSGYGQKGLMSHLGSHDINYMSISGVLSQVKDAQGRPVHPSITFADLIGSMAATEAMAAALVQRERTGKGAYLDIAIADVMHDLMTNHVPLEAATGTKRGTAMIDGSRICYQIYETKDRRYMSLGALELKFWEQFCRAVDREDWIGAQMSETDESNPVYRQVKELFLSRTFQEWTEFSRKVDCCMAPVLETDELKDSPYAKERELIRENRGLWVVATRYQPDGFRFDYPEAPKLGEHTDQFLKAVSANSKKVSDYTS